MWFLRNLFYLFDFLCYSFLSYLKIIVCALCLKVKKYVTLKDASHGLLYFLISSRLIIKIFPSKFFGGGFRPITVTPWQEFEKPLKKGILKFLEQVINLEEIE